jgi:hypothetical protein
VDQRLHPYLHLTGASGAGDLDRLSSKHIPTEDTQMKIARTLVVAIVGFSRIPFLMAQQADTRAQQTASASAAGAQVNDSANANARVSRDSGNAEVNGNAEAHAAGSADMRPVTGELESKLDTKSARPGDPVVLKTSQKFKTADGMEIPKGSRLVGHVTEVQAHAKGQSESRMGLAFDRVEMKGGQSLAVHSMIESVEPNPSATAAASMANEDAFSAPVGGGGMSAGAAGGARGAGGGGLLAGASGTAGGVGRVGSGLGATAGGAVRTTGNLGVDATGDLAHGAAGVGGAVSGEGSLVARSTGIPGVMLQGEAAGSASGMLSATNRNIHLDSGTQMVVGITAAR